MDENTGTSGVFKDSILDHRDATIAELSERLAHKDARIMDFMNICEDLSRKLEEARGRIGELEARLEIDHEFEFDPEKRDLVRVDIPPEQRSFAHDGIACRDATITLQEEAITEQRARIAELEAAIKPFAELAADTRCDDHYCVLVTNVTNPETHLHVSDLRTARAVLEGKSNA